uniref:Serine-threonine/tyrosine-protein kinase catalytic domain-containing protein n=1 Tax=Rhizophagus irregularis (strain DAOM 181602 / DAOM 197198 / MUCL 43194) TaxID=747089 RepID=U9SNC2_RHIID
MKECWDFNPDNRPTANDIFSRIDKIHREESIFNPTKIIESSDIGPVITNHLGAIYKSRPLSHLIQSAMSLRSSRSQSIGKRKFEDDSVEDSNDNEQSIKKRKFLENENNDYFTKEIELDINMRSNQPRDKANES